MMYVQLRRAQCGHLLAMAMALFVGSCTGDSTSVPGHAARPQLIITDTITLYLDSKTPSTLGSIVFNEYDSLLYLENRPNHSIDKYSMVDGTLVDRIAVPRDGPFRISILQGFSIFPGSDSLILYELRFIQNAVVVSNGRFRSLLSESLKAELGQQFINHISIPTAPSVVVDNVLHVQQWPLIDLNNWDLIRDFPDFLAIDLEEQTITYHSAPDPHYFRGDRFFGAQGLVCFRAVFPNGTYIISYTLSDSLYSYSCDDGQVRSYYSNLQRAFPKFKGLHQPIAVPEYDKYYIDKGFYFFLYYDPFNELVHRIARLPDKGRETYQESLYRRNEAILTHDESLNVVAETRLQGGMFNSTGAFVSPFGLCIPLGTDSSDSSGEDQLHILVFSYEK